MKYKVDVPLWRDDKVEVEAKNKKEAMERAVEIIFTRDRKEDMDFLFDYDRFTGGCIDKHTIDDFVKEIKDKPQKDTGDIPCKEKSNSEDKTLIP